MYDTPSCRQAPTSIYIYINIIYTFIQKVQYLHINYVMHNIVEQSHPALQCHLLLDTSPLVKCL